MTERNPSTLPLATSTWNEEEYAAMSDVIASGVFTMGERVARFEREFAAFFGSRHAVMVNSGSSANLLAVAATVLNPEVDLNPGDEVIVPAVSWSTTYYPLHQYGLVLRFVDVDPDTLNMSLDAVESAIGPRTRGVFAVNLLGNPVDYSRLQALATTHGLTILEDNCESLGATLGGRHTGTFGHVGTFSTFFSHHISTMEGGVVLTDDERTYHMLVSMRAHGWTRGLPSKNFVHDHSAVPFDDLFRFVLPGYNLRPLELSGAIGSAQLKKVPALVAGRQENARYFTQRFSPFEHAAIQRETGESSWFGFALTLRAALEGRRADVVGALAESGIESRPIVAGNFARNPVMEYMHAVIPDSLPAADRIHTDGLFVGNHHYDVTEGIEAVHTVLSDLATR